MIQLLLLSVALSPQAAPAHAALHPAETDVYLEITEVASTLQALDKAPVFNFLRDERLKGLLEGLGQSPGRPLPDLVREAVGSAWPGIEAAKWIDGLKTASVSLRAREDAADGEPAFEFLALADFASADQAQALRSSVLALAGEHEPVSDSLPGLERLFRAGEVGEPWCAVVETRFLLGNGAGQPADYAARAGSKAAGLAGSEPFVQRLAALGSGSGTPLLWFALGRSLEDVMASSRKGGGGAGLAFLSGGPSELNPFASPCLARVSLAGDRFVSEMIASEAPRATAKAVDPAWLEPVPAGSMFVFSSAFDGAAAGKRLREILTRDEAGTQALAAIEAKLGFGPERVLARLGPGMTLYAAPLTGLGLPDSRVWIDCDDPAAFTSDFEALFGALAGELPGFQAKTRPYKVKQKGSEEKLEVPVTTLTLPPGMVQIPMISLAPSFAPVGKKLVFGFGSMDVKNELKRVHSGDGEPIVAGADPLAGLGFRLPPDAQAVVVMDWAKLLGGAVQTFQAFAGMAAPGDLPFDPKQLPKAEMFAQYFRPAFYYSRSIEGGKYRRNEGSFGPETWGGLGALVVGVLPKLMGGQPIPALEPAPADGGK